MQLIDTHVHLDHEYFKADCEQVAERACAAGVTRWVNPSLSFKHIPTVAAIHNKRVEEIAEITTQNACRLFVI